MPPSNGLEGIANLLYYEVCEERTLCTGARESAEIIYILIANVTYRCSLGS